MVKNAPALQSNAALITANRRTKSFISYQLRKRKTSIGCLLANTMVEQRAVGCRRPQFAKRWLNSICGEANRIAFSIISICWREEIFMSAVFRPFPAIFSCTHTHARPPQKFQLHHTYPQDPSSSPSLNHTRWMHRVKSSAVPLTYLWTVLLQSVNHCYQMPWGKE